MAGLDEGTFLNFNENASYSIGQFYLISLRKEANKSRKSYLTNKINKTNK